MRLTVILSAAVVLVTMPAMAVVRPKHPAPQTTSHTTTHHTTTTRTKATSGKHRHTVAHAAPHKFAAPAMTTERATAIQTALIKNGYMTGEPTGQWDAASIAAMQKLQSDNGWQTKIMPDSRALIKLGLGPQSPQ